jgi:hypothetical protein
MDIELHGRVTGGAVRHTGAYRSEFPDHVVTITAETVSVLWRNAPDDSGATTDALKAWFDALMLAQTLRTGKRSTVHWTGRTVYDAGRAGGAAWFAVGGPMFVFRHPARLGRYARLAESIERHPLIREASEHVRGAVILFEETEFITSLGESYLAVATLVAAHSGDEQPADWRSFGVALSAVGQPFDADDLEQLYASCQWGRHYLQNKATKTLLRLGRPQLNEHDCMKRAAEVVTAFADARAVGQM